MAETDNFDAKFLVQTEWYGFFGFEGAALINGLHPTKITVTDTSITFDYTVGGRSVSRAYALTRSGKKITSFTNPDGTPEITPPTIDADNDFAPSIGRYRVRSKQILLCRSVCEQQIGDKHMGIVSQL